MTVFLRVVARPCQHYKTNYILHAYCVDLFQMFYCNMLFFILIHCSNLKTNQLAQRQAFVYEFAGSLAIELLRILFQTKVTIHLLIFI